MVLPVVAVRVISEIPSVIGAITPVTEVLSVIDVVVQTVSFVKVMTGIGVNLRLLDGYGWTEAFYTRASVCQGSGSHWLHFGHQLNIKRWVINFTMTR